MNGRHHLMAGACAGCCLTASAICSNNFEVVPVILGFGGVLLGSLFPDIDSTTSKLGQRFKFTSRIISNIFGHRGLLHCPFLIVILYFLFRHLFSKYNIMQYHIAYIWFLIGMVVHLFCDMMTKGGIPLFYPFYKTKFSLTNMKSGSKREPIALFFVCLVFIGITIFCINNNWYIV